MKTLIAELKQLIAEEDPIYSSSEEAAYFRQKWNPQLPVASKPNPLPVQSS